MASKRVVVVGGNFAGLTGALGPRVHAMKVAFEKYYLSRNGCVRLP